MGKEPDDDGDQYDAMMDRTLWLNTSILALSTGLICGAIIFVATNWLVLKGGNPVGPHLQLLSQFFWGYRVTFMGSFVGFLYGFVSGGFCGGCVGWIYNKIAGCRNGGGTEPA